MDPRLNAVMDAAPYPLLFVTISGSHLYGFDSPDSDYDLRGVHLLPLPSVLGLARTQETIDQTKDVQGLEVDLVTHDATKFFTMLLKKNGYVMEQVFSPLVLRTCPEHEELKEIAGRCLTRYHAHHYLGFAETQWGLFAKENPPRVKPLLYVYRVLLTGIHLMQTGVIEANLLHLNETARLPQLGDLIDRKRGGPEQAALGNSEMEFHEREYLRLRSQLELEMERSSLPEKPGAAAELSGLLVRLRLRDPQSANAG